MKALLILALAFQIPVFDKFSGPHVKSKVVEVRNHGLFSDYDPEPERVTLQSVRAGNEDYFLLLEVASREWQMVTQPCKIYLVVNTRPLTLPCAGGRGSTEIIGGSGKRGPVHITNLIVSSKKVESVLKAKSVEMRVGLYKFKLSHNQLVQLSSVVRASR